MDENVEGETVYHSNICYDPIHDTSYYIAVQYFRSGLIWTVRFGCKIML